MSPAPPGARRKIIIDTDAGIDDALAISFALAHPRIELVGITTVFGNVPLETATANALGLGAGRAPVCAGAAAPLRSPRLPCPDWIHGADGFGDSGAPAATTALDGRPAVDFIAEQLAAAPGEITLVPVGPLTNVAALIERHPAAVGQAEQVVLMGGAAHVTGNVTPLAEFNIAGDPEAADMVFAAGWPVTMIGLDVTGDTVLTKSDFARIAAASSAHEFLARAANKYIDFYTERVGLAGCCMHDVCAVACVIEPELFEFAAARIRVECAGFSRGCTAVMPGRLEDSLRDWIDRPDWSGEDFVRELKAWLARPQQRYAAAVDKKRITEQFVATLCSAG